MLCSKRYYCVTVETKCCPVSYCYCLWWHIFITEQIISFAGSGGYINHSVTSINQLVERVYYLFITVSLPLGIKFGSSEEA